MGSDKGNKESKEVKLKNKRKRIRKDEPTIVYSTDKRIKL